MQPFKRDKFVKYAANWSCHFITLEFKADGRWHVKVGSYTSSFITPESAVRAAAEYLMGEGCYAMVNGLRRSVEDFLHFDEVPAPTR